jgi:hypothetical protein
VVELSPGQAGFRYSSPRVEIYRDSFHPADVYDKTAFGHRGSGHIVSSGAHGRIDAAIGGKSDRLQNVIRLSATRNRRRPAVNHPIPNPPGQLIAFYSGNQNFSAESRPQRSKIHHHPIETAHAHR